MSAALDPKIDEKLRGMVDKHAELGRQLADSAVMSDMSEFRSISKQYAQLTPLVEKYAEFRKVVDDYQGARELAAAADDPEMKVMAADEVKALEGRIGPLEEELKVLLLP